MGYMGFGMRRENYSRKPKEVFKNRFKSSPAYNFKGKSGNKSSEFEIKILKRILVISAITALVIFLLKNIN